MIVTIGVTSELSGRDRFGTYLIGDDQGGFRNWSGSAGYTSNGEDAYGYADRLLVAASSSVVLDLLTLDSPVDVSQVLAFCTDIVVYADSDNKNDVQLGPAATDPFEGFQAAGGLTKIKPGGVVAIGSGEDDPGAAVVAGASKIRIVNGGADDAVVKVFIRGTA